MKGMITDNAFDKAWKKPCKHCDNNKPNLKLFFRERCDDCQRELMKKVEFQIKLMEKV
jgi:hypothetical protein